MCRVCDIVCEAKGGGSMTKRNQKKMEIEEDRKCEREEEANCEGGRDKGAIYRIK